MNTPPSGLALKVGREARKRACWPLTFTAQHLSQSASERASRSPKVQNFVQPLLVMSADVC